MAQLNAVVVDVALLAGEMASAVAADLGLGADVGRWLAVASVRGELAGAAWPDPAGPLTVWLYGTGDPGAVRCRLRDVTHSLLSR